MDVKPQSRRSLIMDQSIGFRSAAPLYCGDGFKNTAQSTATPAMMAARMAVADRHVKAIATSIGRITVDVPSPTPPPTAAKSPNVKPRSFGLNHCEMAPVIQTYAPAAAIPFNTDRK